LVAGRGNTPAADAAPTPNGYALVQDVSTANVGAMIDFALIPGRPDEAVVITQTGMAWRVSLTGAFARTEFGNLTGLIRGGTGGEEGLLSLAFSPNFVSDARVYVYYTPTSARCAPIARCSRIARMPVVSNDMVEVSETVVLDIDQEIAQSNHNGGRLLFGPDGYLYLSIGDGGGAGDPNETGQDINDLLGAMIRINVTGQQTYTIPADNPFVGVPGRDELWAYGLRNPWRYSFDRVSGDLWMADVGQGTWEEVEKITKGGNYGWDCYEGNVSFEPAGCTTPPSPFIFPRAVYDHSLGCSVTGGYVYRGTALHEINGWYVYGDYCSGRIWAVNPADTSAPVQLLDSTNNVISFAELPNGELLVVTFQNAIFRLTCAATPDFDGDGQGNACDLDDDNDTFSDAIESASGTDILDRCADTTTPNDERGPAFGEPPSPWPPDINDDRLVDVIGDISVVAGAFGLPQAPARYDIAPDPPDGLIDVIGDISRMAGLFGTACVP
jgi:glucose/arabinose dehydrogenase